MKESNAPLPIRFFAGLGLVLVGLMTGILIMLFVINGSDLVLDEQPVVERVELRTQPEREVALFSDSSRVSPLSTARVLSESFQDVARTVTPAVVFISVSVTKDGNERGWLPRFSNPRQSVGSGVIISESGYIVTNNHVVEGAEDILVTLYDKRQYKARIVGTDKSTDLAVIKAESAAELPYVVLGSSEDVDVGEWVIAIGNPFRLTSTVTAGIVSALGRQVDIINDEFGIEDFIQTDAAINPGNSGGALVNLQGELIGINTAIATESGSYEGYGFAVPVDLVERVAQDLISFGQMKRGFLGVSISKIDAKNFRDFGLDRISGVYLSEVYDGGPAHQSGMKKGDVVLSIDGRSVNAPNELQRVVATRRPGDLLAVEVWRRKSLRTYYVELFDMEDPKYNAVLAEMQHPTLRERPMRSMPLPPEQLEAEMPKEAREWGIGLQELTASMQSVFDVEHGVYVAFILKDSPAFNASLPRDVILTKINGQAVESVGDALALLDEMKKEGHSVLFQVKRKDRQLAFYETEFSNSIE